MATTVPGLRERFPFHINQLSHAMNQQINITDILLVTSKDPIPTGYTKYEKTKTNKRCGLHAHGPDQALYFCIQRDPSKTPITGVMFVCDEHTESIAPGYHRVERTLSGKWAGLRSEKDHTRVFLCVRRGGTSPPIFNIEFINPNKEIVPANCISLSTSPSGLDVKLSAAKGGGAFMLCYQQRLLHLGNPQTSPVVQMPALGVLLRALYTHDTRIVTHCLSALQSMIKSQALFPNKSPQEQQAQQAQQEQLTDTKLEYVLKRGSKHWDFVAVAKQRLPESL